MVCMLHTVQSMQIYMLLTGMFLKQLYITCQSSVMPQGGEGEGGVKEWTRNNIIKGVTHSTGLQHAPSSKHQM